MCLWAPGPGWGQEVLQLLCKGRVLAPCPSKPGPCIPRGMYVLQETWVLLSATCWGTGWHGATLCGGCHCPSAGEAGGANRTLALLPVGHALRVHTPASCICLMGHRRAPSQNQVAKDAFR